MMKDNMLKLLKSKAFWSAVAIALGGTGAAAFMPELQAILTAMLEAFNA